VTTRTIIECRSCGAGAPADAHFCPQCSRILSLGRDGDYFSFLGLPRRLALNVADIERRFRDLSRRFHPDYFYNTPAAERLASLERSSYLNDAYRVLRNKVTRVEYLLGLEGLAPTKTDGGAATVPPALLEEVFALNESLEEIRELREAGADPASLLPKLEAARKPIERKRDEHERQLADLSAQWDERQDRATLEALRERMLERNYINNLLATIDREMAAIGNAVGADPQVRRGPA
jgi:molecular chaperone HscB